MLDQREVYARLEVLQGADLSNRVFGSNQHRYLLTPPWPERRVATFETRHGIALPDGYRHFLTKVGAAGAGPGYGLFEPGTWDDEPRVWEGGDRVAPLAHPFAHKRAWNLARDRLARLSADPDDDVIGAEYWSPAITAGAMPIGSLGGGTRLLLVISGPERGRIWIDDREHDRGLSPEAGLDFDGWYRTWLDGAEATVLDRPKRRTTGRRGERPPRTVALEGPAALAAARLRDRVHAALAAGQSVDLGGLGRFSAGPHPHFEQGIDLRDALLVRAPPPGAGDAHDVFSALFASVAADVAVEVPGLFVAWRAAAAVWEYADYLGRRQVAEEPALLVIVDDPTLPRA